MIFLLFKDEIGTLGVYEFILLISGFSPLLLAIYFSFKINSNKNLEDIIKWSREDDTELEVKNDKIIAAFQAELKKWIGKTKNELSKKKEMEDKLQSKLQLLENVNTKIKIIIDIRIKGKVTLEALNIEHEKELESEKEKYLIAYLFEFLIAFTGILLLVVITDLLINLNIDFISFILLIIYLFSCSALLNNWWDKLLMKYYKKYVKKQENETMENFVVIEKMFNVIISK